MVVLPKYLLTHSKPPMHKTAKWAVTLTGLHFSSIYYQYINIAYQIDIQKISNGKYSSEEYNQFYPGKHTIRCLCVGKQTLSACQHLWVYAGVLLHHNSSLSGSFYGL